MDTRNRMLVLGRVVGVYRSQMVLDYFSSRADTKLLSYTKFDSNFMGRVLRKLKFDFFVQLAIVLFWRPTHIWLLAMNRGNHWLLRLGRMLGSEVIVDFYSGRAEIARENRKINESAPSDAVFRRLLKSDLARLRFSTTVLFLTEAERKRWSAELHPPLPLERSATVPLVVPSPRVFRSEPKVPDSTLTVCWWGRASHLHGLPYVFREMFNLFEQGQRIRFRIYDNNLSRLRFLRHMVDSKFPTGYAQSVVLRLGPPAGIPQAELVRDCDLALGPMGFTNLGTLSTPNKLVEAWALRIPCVTQWSKSLPLGSEKACFLVENDRPGSLAKAIIGGKNRLQNSSEIRRLMDEGTRIYRSNYSEQAFFRSIEAILSTPGPNLSHEKRRA